MLCGAIHAERSKIAGQAAILDTFQAILGASLALLTFFNSRPHMIFKVIGDKDNMEIMATEVEKALLSCAHCLRKFGRVVLMRLSFGVAW